MKNKGTLYTLTYESVAVENLNINEMNMLLEKARTNNVAQDITGCLVYYNGGFVQVLEGEKTVITTLYDKIKSDERHRNVNIFSRDEIGERTFPNWGMAYYPIDPNSASENELKQFKMNLLLLADLSDAKKRYRTVVLETHQVFDKHPTGKFQILKRDCPQFK